jgi:hypothetical protein
MTLRLTLGYWGSSTLEIGVEVDDHGHATGWQTGGVRVGRFARELTWAEQAALDEAMQNLSYDGGPGAATGDAPTAPSGVAEQLVGDGLHATFDPVSGPPPGLEPLVAILTSVRDDLVESPVAAVELSVSGSRDVRLRHAGSEPIRLRADGPLRVDITAYDADNTLIDTETHSADVTGLGDEVAPGWEQTLLDRIALTAPSGGWLSVSVSSLDVDALGDGVLRKADLSWVST